VPSIDLHLSGDRCWPDLPGLFASGQVVDLMGPSAPPLGMALLPGGMQSGKSSVTFRIELPDGRTLLTETSLALLESAVRAMRIRSGEEG
jgi:hypothetical protein